ncbi:MAG: sulfotransferase domain-containing protein [Planctomycetes bacterium]|nr:sulfotransferase domain-containing protein [Planctomycetota bacterium]
MPSPTDSFLTIVSGLPRSGTSMMMRMLAEGGVPPLIDNIRKADEDNPEGYYEFEPVKQTKKDASWLSGANGKVVKMVYRLLYDLPAGREYRVVFMRRKLEEVIKSQEVMLERKGRAGGDMSDDKLIALFRDEIARCEDWLKKQPHFRFMVVDYNEMVKDPAPLVEKLNEFLGGALDKQKMLAVVNPNLYRQRK